MFTKQAILNESLRTLAAGLSRRLRAKGHAKATKTSGRVVSPGFEVTVEWTRITLSYRLPGGYIPGNKTKAVEALKPVLADALTMGWAFAEDCGGDTVYLTKV